MAGGSPSDLSPDRRTDVNGVPVIRVRLLGAFHVSVGGVFVPESAWRQRRAAAVVKLLALEPTHRLHRERLIDQLWPELDLDAGLNNLRQALYHARRQLESAGAPPEPVLRRDGDTVVLADAGRIWVDVHAFERAARQAWQSLSAESILTALDLYANDLLPDDLYEEWTEPLRSTLRAGYLALLTRLGELYVELGEPRRAIDAFQRLVHAEPGLETGHRSLMRLYAETGQPETALAQYDRLATILARDLDETPEPSTRELARAIADGQPPPSGVPLSPSPPARSTFSLPTPVSPLIGRMREVAEVRQLLRTERLVTLTGTGGIGKTRVAIETAREMTDAFPDGIAFVDLASLDAPELVIPSIAQVLGVRETGGQPLDAALAASLRGRSLLLILDNFERVSGAGRDVVVLLEQAPSLRALVTSRVRLRVRGEREYPVPPLAIVDQAGLDTAADAVALFVERARAVRPSFQLTTENATAIEAICRRLAGLPLAIELAAARSRLLSPDAILARLERPLELLASGPADLPARQQTIRATIQWSVDLLDADERKFFTRLSVFAGGWTLDAAEAVALDPDTSTDALGYLESLVDRNLVTQLSQPDGEVRFGILETIREFALEQLTASGEDSTVRDWHAAWVVQLVERAEPYLEGINQAAWLARLAREDDNIRAGLAWLRETDRAEMALRLVPTLRLSWFSLGRLREGYEQVVAITDLPRSADYPALRADALIAASFLAREIGDFQRAFDAARASLAISHQIRDRKRAADALVNLGFIALQRGQIADARTLLRRSLTINNELDNQQGVADSLGLLALVDLRQGALDAAERQLEESLAIWKRLDDLQGVAWASAHIGLVRLEQGEHRSAWDALMSSLAISEVSESWGDTCLVIDGLARLASIYDQSDLAARLSATAASVRQQAGIRLPPPGQSQADSFPSELQHVGDREPGEAWSHRRDWTLEEIITLVRESLGPLIGERKSPAVPPESP